MSEVELAVIGCLILNEKAQPEILDRVKKSDFMSPDLGDLFERLRRQWEETGRVDAVTVAALPQEQKVLAVQCCEAPIVYSAYASYIKAMLDASKGAKAQTIGLKLATGDCTVEQIWSVSPPPGAGGRFPTSLLYLFFYLYLLYICRFRHIHLSISTNAFVDFEKPPGIPAGFLNQCHQPLQ